MAESMMSFREVCSGNSSKKQPFWKEITIPTGSTGSSSGEKLSSCAGGHSYRESGRVGSSVRNRFITWRSQGNVLDLTEESLDYNLTGSHLRLRFSGAPILPGVSVHEGHGCVVILVATTASVHRLIFPHPNKLDKHDVGRITHLSSIFAEWSVAHVNEGTNCYTVQQPAAAVYKLHTSGAWMTGDGHALFALASNAGSIVFIKMPPFGIQGVVSQNELRQSSVMQRLWTGLMPSVISGGNETSDTAYDVMIHPLGQDTYIFAICQDHKLRMWSCKTMECVMVSDLLEFTPDNMDPAKITPGGEGHMIRKCVSTTQMLQLGVFLSFSDRAQFCVLQPVMSDGRHQLKHITSIFAPQEDLIDFCVTSGHVWTTWTDGEGETAYRAAPITGDLPAVQKWQDVFIDEESQLAEVVVPDHQDPREAYIEHIFNGSACFSASVVQRALKLYRRSMDASVIGQSVLDIDTVKAEAVMVVEHEIQSCASEYEMTDEEYYQLQLQQWNKFFTCCVQYQQQDNTPIACFADNNTGMVTVVKKGAYSYLRPCHALEHITLSSTLYMEQFNGLPVLADDDQLCRDVISLSGLLQLVQSCMSAEMLYLFHQDIRHNQPPEQSAQQIVSAIMAHTSTGSGQSGVSEKLRQIELRLHEVQDVVQAVDLLLQLMDVMQGNPAQMNDSMIEANRQLSSSHLFASQTAVDILVRCMQQQCRTRMTLATNTLLLLTLMCHLGDQANLQLGVTEKIRCELIGRSGHMVQVYYLMYWASTELASQVSTTALEINARAIEALGLSESVASPSIHRYGDQRIGLLELYLCGQGGSQLRSVVAQQPFLEEDPCPLWTQALLHTTGVLLQLIWPINMNFDFPESLLVECQFSQVQNYVRLAQDWNTDWNMSSRKFALGYSYLNTMEPHKALDCFFEVVHGLGNEEFLMKLLKVTSEVSGTQLEILYYLKVIKLFEEFSLPQIVITMATSAISIADEDDPNVPTLWSKIFKHQLLMGHSDEAYSAMIANPDPSRRKDCLRQLLVVLCERGELQQLVQFPYIDLESDVVAILESRARSVDLTTHNYYDLLYAFHVFRNNYRKAGSVMYEYGMRLAQEVPGRKGLQRQAKCYLAAMNALRLVNENYAWIVKPVTTDKDMMDTDDGGRSPKHSLSGIERHMQMKRKMEVLKLEDIEQEYMLVHARLQLLQRDPDSAQIASGNCSAQETISLLVNAGMFDCAINICKMFKLQLTAVFEGLASRCIKLADGSYDFMQGDNDYTAQAWEWLEQNELTPYTAHKDLSSGDQAWRLLQTYLMKYDEDGSRHYKTVAMTLLSHGFNLPNWFIASYKRVNAAELLRLYIDFDLLEDAAHLTMEYIDAVLGRGPEYFGLKNALQFNKQPVWLPYTCIDQLLIALKDGDIDTSYTELSTQLHQKLKHYNHRVEKASQDRLSAGVAPMVM